MENASKALIIAAEVLIGVLILTLALYLIITFGAQSREIHKQVEANQLTQYNAQYTIYAGRKDITIHEIVSIANLAKENNNKYKDLGDFEEAYKVTVILQGLNSGDNSNQFQNVAATRASDYLKKYGTDIIDPNTGEPGQYFKCTEEIKYHSNGKVKSITFSK